MLGLLFAPIPKRQSELFVYGFKNKDQTKTISVISRCYIIELTPSRLPGKDLHLYRRRIHFIIYMRRIFGMVHSSVWSWSISCGAHEKYFRPIVQRDSVAPKYPRSPPDSDFDIVWSPCIFNYLDRYDCLRSHENNLCFPKTEDRDTYSTFLKSPPQNLLLRVLGGSLVPLK